MKSIVGLILVLGVGSASCATNFSGSPYVEGGRSGCEAKCRGQGMDVAGMVYMGEYSSACVCSVPGQSASARQQVLLGSTAGTTGGAVGVVMQQQRSQEQQSRR
jgi:hypothetical protein